MAHIRQSRPDYVLNFQVKFLELSPLRSGAVRGFQVSELEDTDKALNPKPSTPNCKPQHEPEPAIRSFPVSALKSGGGK